jgi:hypothetical protein
MIDFMITQIEQLEYAGLQDVAVDRAKLLLTAADSPMYLPLLNSWSEARKDIANNETYVRHEGSRFEPDEWGIGGDGRSRPPGLSSLNLGGG